MEVKAGGQTESIMIETEGQGAGTEIETREGLKDQIVGTGIGTGIVPQGMNFPSMIPGVTTGSPEIEGLVGIVIGEMETGSLGRIATLVTNKVGPRVGIGIEGMVVGIAAPAVGNGINRQDGKVAVDRSTEVRAVKGTGMKGGVVKAPPENDRMKG